jgi:P-type Cu+ transporter
VTNTALSSKMLQSNPQDPEKVSLASSQTTVDKMHSSVTRISPDVLEVGDIVRVLHGASPPADGTLVNVGEALASFDESSLTGESRPAKKGVGDQVFVGTINRGSVVDVRVDAIGGQTMYVTPTYMFFMSIVTYTLLS